MPRRRLAPFDIPREIVIRGKRWLVALDTELGDDKHDVRSRINLQGPLWAVTYREHHDHIKREIHLSSKHSSERELAKSFIHEVMHACVPYTPGKAVIPNAQEEKFISAIETPFFRVLEQLRWRDG